jgi:membrane-associated phospholipid phosphatase
VATIALVSLLWLIVYFIVNRLRVDPRLRRDYSLPIDKKIPFVPLFAWVYFSIEILVLHPFLFLSDARQFYWMLACFILNTILFSLIHIVIPSKVERIEQTNTGGIAGKMLRQWQKTCRPYGNFPSMHTGFSVPVVIANYMALGVVAGSITLVWAVLIALSTLFLKQHYIVDVLAALGLGILTSGLMYWLMCQF